MNIGFFAFTFGTYLADTAIGILAYTEHQWLMSDEKQREFYRSFYYRGNPGYSSEADKPQHVGR